MNDLMIRTCDKLNELLLAEEQLIRFSFREGLCPEKMASNRDSEIVREASSAYRFKLNTLYVAAVGC